MVKKWSVSYPAVNGTEQRRVYVYLPTMYEADPDRRYPVLYMFDGQNVFFDEDATFGKSWGVADYLDYTDTPLIVAAVECNAGANNERWWSIRPTVRRPQFGHFDGTGQATMTGISTVQTLHRPQLPHSARPGAHLHRRQQHGRPDEPVRPFAVQRHFQPCGGAVAVHLGVAGKASGLVGRAKLEPGTVLYMDYGSREMGNHDGMRCGFAEMCAKVMTRGIHLTSASCPAATHERSPVGKNS